ncbi:nuclear transport factor 2 family protein [Blastococcus sp. URHD0036]|uniref:nuclear transport factor 2 family protein n=1 Tax=Blastococcus sp. URHD0036 TaxID=1380356 RepID=UPI000497BBCC|nr:nuclear transport factor 2 family protein [Blastococcus sp. URHD0036]
MTDDLREDLLGLERRGWDALCDGSAADFYGQTMTPGGVMVLANGAVMSRDEVVTALAGSPAWASYELADVMVVPVGTDGAAMVYTGRAWREAGGEPFVCAMTSTYVRTPDGWRLALYTQTPVG